MRLTRVALLAFTIAVSAVPLGADIIEQILVKVNGDIITKTDLEERQVAYLRQQNKQYADEELRQVLAQITPQLLADAIDELLLVQRGRELGYRMAEDQFKEIIERIKKENDIKTEEQFQSALKQEGMTLADLRRSLERQVLISRVQQIEILGKVGITEVEARQYYDAHPDEFRLPATVTLREILIEIPGQTDTGVNVGLDEEARAKAEQVRARLLAGDDFAKVAADVSAAPSKANGGLVGPINRAELAPAIQQALDTMKVGDVSEVLRTTRGYVILKLESAAESTLRPFEDVRDDIADRVFNDRRRAELVKYVKRLREQAIIEWKHEELKKAYEQYISSAQSGTP